MEPVRYSDGVVTIRALCEADLDADLAAKDGEQITWLWEPGQRAAWEAMTGDEQRDHARRTLRDAHASFGPGPKWCFAVDTSEVRYVAYVDCDLANDHVPRGDANVSYSAHPTYRGRGYVSRAVRLVLRFLTEHTDAARAHVIVDLENAASLRVARSVGASVTDSWRNEQGRTMVRHVVLLSRRATPRAPGMDHR
jgi:RimJ/RimL family protein N-acetyltransferase